jgi:hypothetical protein
MDFWRGCRMRVSRTGKLLMSAFHCLVESKAPKDITGAMRAPILGTATLLVAGLQREAHKGLSFAKG